MKENLNLKTLKGNTIKSVSEQSVIEQEEKRNRFESNKKAFRNKVLTKVGFKNFIDNNYFLQVLTEGIFEILYSTELQSNIENGKYNLLIGEDASGRVPTLLLNKYIREVYKDRGYNEPELLFLPGQRTETDQISKRLGYYLEEIFSKRGLDIKNQNVLIITESMVSGRSMLPLVTALQQQSIPYDITSLSLEGFDEKHLEVLLNGKVFAPKDMQYGFPFAQESKFSGVKKKYGALQSKRVENTQATVNKAREDVNFLVEEFVDWYKAHKNTN